MKIAEIFYSIQGEVDIGRPSIFLRLSGCNLIKINKACKWCDSMFAEKGKEMTQSEIISALSGYGCINVVITGGEPLYQRDELFQLVKELNDEGWDINIETNGTIFDSRVFNYVNRISCSPKRQDFDLRVLKQYASIEQTRFKFVYESKKNKWWEKIIDTLNISSDRIWIMPEGRTKKEQLSKMKEVIEYCKEKGYNFSPRLHVLVWDKKRKV